MTTSFADHNGFLQITYPVEQLCEQQAKTGINTMKCGKRSPVIFNNFKDENIAFTLCRKPDLKPKLPEVTIPVRDYTLTFYI